MSAELREPELREPEPPPRYKQPISPLAGPYGHPYHPLAVTLPIGAWCSSFVFDVLSRSSNEPRGYAQGAAKLIETGIVGAGVAAVFGFLDYLQIPRKVASPVGITASTHMLLNASALLLFAVNLNRRERRLRDTATANEPVGNAEIALSTVTLAMLSVSGWLGGKLSYQFGVRVADEGTQRKGT